MDFEEALDKLEQKVQQLSDGKLKLDEALKAFQEGMELFKFCSERLQEAEQRVTKLVSDIEGLREEPFKPD